MAAIRYFNSHAHVERDNSLKAIDIIISISTHTLTWSVTAIYCADDRYTDYFNSHAHVERDLRACSSR